MATDLTNVAVSTGFTQLLHIDGGIGGSVNRIYDGDGTGSPLEISSTTVQIKDGSFDFNVASHDGTNGLKLGGTLVTASATELNYVDVSSIGTAEASKAIILDSNKDITGIRNLTATGQISAADFVTTGNTTIGNAADDTIAMNATITTDLIFEGSSADANELTLTPGNPGSDITITLPSATDTLVGRATTDTLTNKTLTSPDINAPDIDGGTVDAITSLTVANSVDIGNYTITANGFTADGTIQYGSLSDGSITITAFVDEDGMDSNSATLVPTQQSVKAYVDAQVTAQDLDATTDSGTIAIDLDSETLTIAGGEGIDTSATSNTITIAGEDASTSNKGVASFSSDNFAVSSGAVTIKDNGVILATETTGDYVQNITGGTGIDSTGATSGENIAHTLSIDLNELTTETSIADDDFIAMVDATDDASGKITFENLEDAIFASVSGDIAIAEDGAATIQANSVALGTDTTGNYVATIADSGGGGITVANSGAESAAVTLELDIKGLTDDAIASGDFIAFSDEGESGDPANRGQIDDVATLFAGTGLTASSAVIGVDASQTQITSVGTLGAGAISSGFGAIDNGSSTANFGATTVDSLSVSDGNVTNVGDIALDSISADDNDINVAITNNRSSAFEIKQGSDKYFGINTTTDGDVIQIGTGISGTAITLGHSTSEITVADNLTVTGNLKVNGDQVYQNVTQMAVNDPIISLQTGTDGANLGADTNKDVGLAMFYHNGSAAKTAFLGFDDSAGKLTFIPDATISSEVASGTAGTIVANLEGNVTGNVTGNTSGTALTVTQAAQTAITSVGTLTALQVDNININGNTIISSDTNGHINLTPNGSGEVNISKVDIDSGTIDGATIATSDVTVGSGKTLDVSGGTLTLADDQIPMAKTAIVAGTGISLSTNTLNVDASQTGFTSLLNASLVAGRDAHNQIKFSTDDQIIFRVADGDGVIMKASGEIEATSLDISGDIDVDGTTNLDVVDIDGAVDMASTLTTADAITQGSGVLTIKNATGDSNGLRIFQDSSDASKIYNNFNGTLQLGVGNTTALTIDSSENSTFAGTITGSYSNSSGTDYLDGDAGLYLANSGSDGTMIKFGDTNAGLVYGGSGSGTFKLMQRENTALSFDASRNASFTAGVDISGATTINSTDNSVNLTLKSTDADNASGPLLDLYRESATAADDDYLGIIRFSGKEESNGSKANYAQIISRIVDASAGTPDGRLDFEVAVNDSGTTMMSITDRGIGVNTTTPGTTSTAGPNETYLCLDGGSNGGVIECKTSNNGDTAFMGGIDFVNDANGDNSNNDADGKLLAFMRARAVTSDNNASDDSGGFIQFATKPEAGSLTERLRIDSAGNTTIGTFSMTNPNTTYKQLNTGGFGVLHREAYDAYITSNAYYNTSNAFIAKHDHSDGIGTLNLLGGRFTFNAYSGSVTAGTAYTTVERMNIASDGTLSVSSVGTNATEINNAHTFRVNANDSSMVIDNVTTSGNPHGLQIRFSGNGHGTGGNFIDCYSGTTGSLVRKFMADSQGEIYSAGGIEFAGSTLGGSQTGIGSSGSGGDLLLYSNGSAHARLNSNGALLVGDTAQTDGELFKVHGTTDAKYLVRIHQTNTAIASDDLIMQMAFDNDASTTAGARFIVFEDSNTTMGSIAVATNVDQIVYNTTSDERLKENIKDASSQLKTINDIQVREFKWKRNGYEDIGVIAQELEKVYPKAVTKGGDDVSEKPYEVSYSTLVIPLIKAVQELSAKVEALENA